MEAPFLYTFKCDWNPNQPYGKHTLAEQFEIIVFSKVVVAITRVLHPNVYENDVTSLTDAEQFAPIRILFGP